jgi:hypothetical protein
MDESAFQKELNKYKVIRQPDYYKSRNRQKVTKAATSNTTLIKEVHSSNLNSNIKIDNESTQDFWEVFSNKNQNILTASESIKLIEVMKRVSLLFLCIFFICCIFK